MKSARPEFRKTWCLQASKPPTGEAPDLVVTNGRGRLFVQAVLPEQIEVKLNSGEALYRYGGNSYPPGRVNGPLPECRIEISPVKASREDYFLNVLTATGSEVMAVPKAVCRVEGQEVQVTLGEVKLTFRRDRVDGSIEINGEKNQFGGRLEKK